MPGSQLVGIPLQFRTPFGLPCLQVQQALGRQRFTLHEGTPGDNVTVMVITLRKLPAIPRTSASRLNLRSSSADLVAMSAAAEHLAPPHSQSADFGKAANGSSSSDE